MSKAIKVIKKNLEKAINIKRLIKCQCLVKQSQLKNKHNTMSDTVAEQRHEKSYQIRKNPGPFKGKFAKSCLKNPSQCTY